MGDLKNGRKMKIEWIKSVRSIITLMLIGIYCTLAIKGAIKPEDIQVITAVIITFYFVGKNRNGGNRNGKTDISSNSN